MDKKGTKIGKGVAYFFPTNVYFNNLLVFFQKNLIPQKQYLYVYDYGMFKVRQVNGLVKWFYQSYSRH